MKYKELSSSNQQLKNQSERPSNSDIDQTLSTEIVVHDTDKYVREDPDAVLFSQQYRAAARRESGIVRLRGFEAIQCAVKRELPLNKLPDSSGPRAGLTVAEATLIAKINPELIWIDVEVA